jgi:flavin reductase (DIM6/NTAB) family NADH-FMN oxidoreductase RutF
MTLAPQSASSHRPISPSVLYFGTPVCLISTLNPDGTTNVAPISSAFYLGETAVLGISMSGQTLANLRRESGLVINLPSVAERDAVERLAPLTGLDPVPAHKPRHRYHADKFGAGQLTPLPSEVVAPERVAECPIQLEADVVALHESREGGFAIVETQVLRIHAADDLVIPGTHHVDTSRWRPLFYVFRHYFGLGDRLGRNFRAEY